MAGVQLEAAGSCKLGPSITAEELLPFPRLSLHPASPGDPASASATHLHSQLTARDTPDMPACAVTKSHIFQARLQAQGELEWAPSMPILSSKERERDSSQLSPEDASERPAEIIYIAGKAMGLLDHETGK